MGEDASYSREFTLFSRLLKEDGRMDIMKINNHDFNALLFVKNIDIKFYIPIHLISRCKSNNKNKFRIEIQKNEFRTFILLCLIFNEEENKIEKIYYYYLNNCDKKNLLFNFSDLKESQQCINEFYNLFINIYNNIYDPNLLTVYNNETIIPMMKLSDDNTKLEDVFYEETKDNFFEKGIILSKINKKKYNFTLTTNIYPEIKFGIDVHCITLNLGSRVTFWAKENYNKKFFYLGILFARNKKILGYVCNFTKNFNLDFKFIRLKKLMNLENIMNLDQIIDIIIYEFNNYNKDKLTNLYETAIDIPSKQFKNNYYSILENASRFIFRELIEKDNRFIYEDIPLASHYDGIIYRKNSPYEIFGIQLKSKTINKNNCYNFSIGIIKKTGKVSKPRLYNRCILINMGLDISLGLDNIKLVGLNIFYGQNVKIVKKRFTIEEMLKETSEKALEWIQEQFDVVESNFNILHPDLDLITKKEAENAIKSSRILKEKKGFDLFEDFFKLTQVTRDIGSGIWDLDINYCGTNFKIQGKTPHREDGNKYEAIVSKLYNQKKIKYQLSDNLDLFLFTYIGEDGIKFFYILTMWEMYRTANIAYHDVIETFKCNIKFGGEKNNVKDHDEWAKRGFIMYDENISLKDRKMFLDRRFQKALSERELIKKELESKISPERNGKDKKEFRKTLKIINDEMLKEQKEEDKIFFATNPDYFQAKNTHLEEEDYDNLYGDSQTFNNCTFNINELVNNIPTIFNNCTININSVVNYSPFIHNGCTTVIYIKSNEVLPQNEITTFLL